MNAKLATFVTFVAVIPLTAPLRAAEPTAAQQLATEFIRTALEEAGGNVASVQSLDAANMLASEATALDPNNAEIWEIALELAMLSERDDLKGIAVEKLSTLEPENETVRLMRLNAAIEQFQTFEQRVAAYQHLLADDNISTIGKPAASRLTLDLALLYQRQNQVDQFSRWLGKAVELDASNRSAAAIATGFFRMHVQDPAAEAELLLNLMIADPTDLTAQAALAQLLLEQGAFTGAQRLYRITVQSTLTDSKTPASNLLIDLAVAQWGDDDDEDALLTLRRRQSAIDDAFRIYSRQQHPDMSDADLKALPAPVDPNIATAIAAIQTGREDQAAQESVATAMKAYDTTITNTTANAAAAPPGTDVSPAAMAKMGLEMAWIGVWMGADLAQVNSALSRAEQLQPLTPEARQRFDGWIAFRKGELDHALELFKPLADADIAAALGIALTHQAQGNLKQAATDLLRVYRAQPGSLIGVWASKRLSKILGTHIPKSAVAEKLEALIASLSNRFDGYAQDSSTAISLRINPVKLNYGPFEPILVNIELTNKTIYPLALDRNGPLRPQVLVIPSVRSAAAPQISELPPFVVMLDRRLCLMPNETVVKQVDIRKRGPASMLTAMSVDGAILKLRGLINFSANQVTGAQAGLYGMESIGPLIRVDGQRISNDWVKSVIELMNVPDQSQTLREMALISRLVAPRQPANTSPEDLKLVESARVSFAEAFSKMSPAAQAWLLCVFPQGTGPIMEGLQPTLDIAKKSDSRLVQLAYLLYQVTSSTDPMVDAAKRSDDATLRKLAEIVQSNLQKAEAAKSLGR